MKGVFTIINKPFRFIEQLYCRFQADDVSALGAQMTYYLILAFFPFLIFLITIITHTPVTSQDILSYISPYLAQNSYQTIENFINETLRTGNTTLLSFGALGALWASSIGMMGIIKGLNKAYDITDVRPFWKARGISLLLTLGLIVVIILSFVLLIFGQRIGEQLFEMLAFPDHFNIIWGLIQYLIPLLSMFIVFVVIYKVSPNLTLSFREVLPGALFAVFGWIIISILFSYYVNNWGNYSKMYGSIGGIIVLLLWLYISSIIILLGGEINAILSFLRDGKQKLECSAHKLNLPFLKKK